LTACSTFGTDSYEQLERIPSRGECFTAQVNYLFEE